MENHYQIMTVNIFQEFILMVLMIIWVEPIIQQP